MPWFRTKLLPGSKILQRQKRWFRFWFFGWRYHVRTYVDLRTPINKLKEKSVSLERDLLMTRAQIEWMQKEYDATVKHMGTLKSFDRDSGAVTQWKYEKLPWYRLSLFQWAIPFVDEPPAFDPKMYGRIARGHTQTKRTKDAEVAVNIFEKQAKQFRTEMESSADPEEKNTTRIATFTPGKGDRGLQKRKGEDDISFEERKEKARGDLDGLDH